MSLWLYNIVNKYCIHQLCCVTNNSPKSQRLTTKNLFFFFFSTRAASLYCLTWLLVLESRLKKQPFLWGRLFSWQRTDGQESKLIRATAFQACARHLDVTLLTFQWSERFMLPSLALGLRTASLRPGGRTMVGLYDPLTRDEWLSTTKEFTAILSLGFIVVFPKLAWH